MSLVVNNYSKKIVHRNGFIVRAIVLKRSSLENYSIIWYQVSISI